MAAKVGLGWAGQIVTTKGESPRGGVWFMCSHPNMLNLGSYFEQPSYLWTTILTLIPLCTILTYSPRILLAAWWLYMSKCLSVVVCIQLSSHKISASRRLEYWRWKIEVEYWGGILRRNIEAEYWDGILRWNIEAEYWGGILRRNIEVEYWGGILRWNIKVEYWGWILRWNIEVEYWGGIFRWNIEVEYWGRILRWNIEVESQEWKKEFDRAWWKLKS